MYPGFGEEKWKGEMIHVGTDLFCIDDFNLWKVVYFCCQGVLGDCENSSDDCGAAGDPYLYGSGRPAFHRSTAAGDRRSGIAGVREKVKM